MKKIKLPQTIKVSTLVSYILMIIIIGVSFAMGVIATRGYDQFIEVQTQARATELKDQHNQ